MTLSLVNLPVAAHKLCIVADELPTTKSSILLASLLHKKPLSAILLINCVMLRQWREVMDYRVLGFLFIERIVYFV